MQRIFTLIIIIFMISSIAKPQDNISIKFIGNCGFYLTDGDFSFYLDFPYRSGAYDYMDYDEKIIDNCPNYSFFS